MGFGADGFRVLGLDRFFKFSMWGQVSKFE